MQKNLSLLALFCSVLSLGLTVVRWRMEEKRRADKA